MIIWDKKNGYTYEDEQTHKRYSLLEGKCYKGECTSDSIIMWDDEKMCFADYVQGATFLYKDIEELDQTIKGYIDAYEAKQTEKRKARAFIKHSFSDAGIKAFEDQASADFFEEFEKPFDDQDLTKFDIMVSCGKHQIRIPLGAEEWNELTYFLKECLEVNQ